MSADDLYSLRMVIQQIGVSHKPTYRVMVYGDNFNPRRAEFSSPQGLLETLRAAAPSFDVSDFSLNPLGEGRGSIVFTGKIELDETQLSILGLH